MSEPTATFQTGSPVDADRATIPSFVCASPPPERVVGEYGGRERTLGGELCRPGKHAIAQAPRRNLTGLERNGDDVARGNWR